MTWQTSYCHYDGQGSTLCLTDENGEITDSYAYTAFGEEVDTGAANPTPNPFRYVGREGYYRDADTGDYYARARVYRPVSAQWLSLDPIPVDVNLYRYAHNNPSNRADPSGLFDFNCDPHYEGKLLPSKALETKRWPGPAPSVSWNKTLLLTEVEFTVRGNEVGGWSAAKKPANLDKGIKYSAIANVEITSSQNRRIWRMNATSTLDVSITCACREEGPEGGKKRQWCEADIGKWKFKGNSRIRPAGQETKFEIPAPPVPWSLSNYLRTGSIAAAFRWGSEDNDHFLTETTLMAYAQRVRFDTVKVHIESHYEGGIKGGKAAALVKHDRTDDFTWTCKMSKKKPVPKPKRN